MAEPLLARIIRRGGGHLLDAATGRLFAKAADAPKPNSSISRSLAGAALTRIATRSVPGALVVGGSLLAKALYDRRHAKRARPVETSPIEASDADA
jgi:hypothetical protein